MLSRTVIRDRPDEVRENLRRRQAPDRTVEVDRLLELDGRVRSLTARRDELRHRSKEASRAIGEAIKQARAAGADPDTAADEARAGVRALGEELKGVEEELRALEEERDLLELGLPNLLDASVPAGVDERDNRVLRTWGEPPDIREPRAHDELGEALGILDFKRAAKVAGARFTFLVGLGARLEHALIRFMRDLHAEAGDTEIVPPYLLNAAALTGTGQLPKFAAELFQVTHESGFYLLPTAEVPVTNYHAGEILDADDLPKRYFAFSPCFRSEAGSYGKDVRGYIRQHQFHKVELVRVATPEQSEAELEAMTDRAEEVLRRLGLHHRVVVLCSGDTGNAAAKTLDVEVWLPSQGRFREISSCSNCTDYQARRARIRYRQGGAKPRHCHTLNGSALAVGRTLVAVLEQGQRPDGSVAIPEALRPYLGAAEIPAP